MVEVICLNDKNRPKEIPLEDFVVEGDKYRVTHVSIQVNQPEVGGGFVIGCDLYEKPLSLDKHYPYECFRFNRFGATQENIEALIELIKDCCNLPKETNFEKILEEAGLETIER